MIFQCQNEDCSAVRELKEVKKATIVIKSGETVCKEAVCSHCGEYMVDITPREGYGNPKKAAGDRGKKFYDRGNSQRVHW